MRVVKIILSIGILGLPVLVNAYADQYPWNPIYVEEVKSPGQLQAEREAKVNEYNLQQQRLREAATSLENGCKNKYGPNSYYKGDNPNTGGHICDCINGYEWQGNNCVLKQQKKTECINGIVNLIGMCVPYDQACRTNYGANSRWAGYLDSNNRYVCGCNDGYRWNDNQTECMPVLVNQNTSQQTCDNGYFKNSAGNCIKNESPEPPAASKKAQPEAKPVKADTLNQNDDKKVESADPTPTTTPLLAKSPEAPTDQIVDNGNIEKTQEKVTEPNRGVIKPIKQFFGKLFNRLASWLMK